MRQQTGQEKEGRDRVEREQRQRSVSNRVEDGGRERPSKERGPVGRQGRDDDRGGRDDWKGNGR
jgi:hypothetical protein